MSKIFKTEYVKAIGGLGPANFTGEPDVVEVKRRYVSPEACAKAAEVGAKAYIRAVEQGDRQAHHKSFWATDRAIKRYARDARYGVQVRVRATITNRNAKYGAIFGKNEYLDPIPKGYTSPYLGGCSWLWPALIRLGWKAPNEAISGVLRDKLVSLQEILTDYDYPKETRDSARASIRAINQLF